jgi:hypothetical protein
MTNYRRNAFRKIYGIAIVIIIALPGICLSQYYDIAAPYLLEPPDARGRSLAGGGGVYANGAIGAFYNPANLVTTGLAAAVYGRSKYWPWVDSHKSLENIWLTSGLGDWGYCGAYGYYIDYGKLNAIPEIMQVFHSSDLVVGISAAILLDNNSSFGLGAKYIRCRLADYSPGYGRYSAGLKETALAFDIGFLSRNHFPKSTFAISKISFPKLRKYCRMRNDKGISCAVSITNLGRNLNYNDLSKTDPLPKQFRLSAGYQLLDSDLLGTRVTIDGSKMLFDLDDHFKNEIREITWTFGIEATALYLITFRAGEHLDKVGEDRYGAYGIGIGPEWLHLDYSRIGHEQTAWREKQESWSVNCNIPVSWFGR